MRTFLGVLMVLIVSGDENTIKGTLEDSVLLPCTCSEINLDKRLQWQMEEPKTLLLKYNRNSSNATQYDRYKGRVKTFLNETNNNCSVLLTNITADDQGKYRCSFHHKEQYKSFFVNLNVSVSYNVCQTSPTDRNGNLSVKVFKCDVNGRYRDAEIQWKLGEQLLTNSPTNNITNKYPLDAPAGLYHFQSTLITKLNMTSILTCDVKAKGISTIISYDCRTVSSDFSEHSQGRPDYNMRYSKCIPIMLVLGLSLLLWRRSHRI